MRIRELLEGKNFNDINFVKQDGDKKDIDYDLVEDLVYFMNNDDDTYRRHVFPSVTKCVHSLKLDRPLKASIFKSAVLDSYKNYLKEYPIRELPSELDDEMLSKVCEKMHDDICKDVEEGKYKD